MAADSAPERSSSVSDILDVTHRDVNLKRTHLIAFVLLVFANACSSTDPQQADVATVERVVDGDTIVLAFSSGEETVRLIGIDTPETVKPNSPVECFGPEASERTKYLLPAGTRVRVERDLEARDRYGRLLVYLRRVDDGLFVNESLVVEGFATPLRIEPNVAYADSFARAADDARGRRLGLWAVCED